MDNPLAYPSYRYHVSKPPVVVANEDEDAALEAGYRPEPYTPEEQAAEALKLAAQAAQTGAASVPSPSPVPLRPLHDVPDMSDMPDASHGRRR